MRRKATRKSGNLKRPKTKLGLPDLDHSRSAVLDSLRSPESKRGYRHAIDEFIQWYCSEPRSRQRRHPHRTVAAGTATGAGLRQSGQVDSLDRKSTRLNS